MKSITQWKKLSPENRIRKALFFDTRKFNELKASCSSILSSSAKAWNPEAKLVTREDYLKRSLETKIVGFGVTMLSNIRYGEKYRAENKFRDCTYTFGKYKDRYVYILHFYKISEARYKNNYLTLDKRYFAKAQGSFSNSELSIKLDKVLEKGNYRYRIIFFNEMNFHFYPKNRAKYSIKVYSEDKDNSTVYRYELRN
jgi:hypothetical protein